ncbi:hypothetical protein RZS08_23945, partial [Arthrospira platensis SPKY1]|nr:hypothetical protein [Arthrospira platensis SPKY1]
MAGTGAPGLRRGAGRRRRRSVVVASALAAPLALAARVHVVLVPVVLHEDHRHAAGTVAAAVLAPLLAVAGRHPHVDRLHRAADHHPRRRHDHRLGDDHLRLR